MSSLIPLALYCLLAMAACASLANFVAAMFDEIRIRAFLRKDGSRLLLCSQRSTRIPLPFAFSRQYDVTYASADGRTHDATCMIHIVFQPRWDTSRAGRTGDGLDMEAAFLQRLQAHLAADAKNR